MHFKFIFGHNKSRLSVFQASWTCPKRFKRSRSLTALQLCTARGVKNRMFLLSITMQMHRVIPPDPEARRRRKRKGSSEDRRQKQSSNKTECPE